jgi:hypothetical protein
MTDRKGKISGAQRLVLQSCVDHGNPMHHIKTEQQRAGWGGTRAALQRRGYLDECVRITPAGRTALREEG